jgi:OH-DDVA oxygenase/3-O-methylgallate 3,4-dioxygenase
MAKIVLGMWTSHGPTLGTTAEQWLDRVPADKKGRHPFRGGTYSFDELVALRRSEDLAAQCTLEEREKRRARCQAAIKVMADKWAEVQPDVCVIMGNDQREVFLPDLTPALTVFCGEKIWNEPVPPEKVPRMPPGIHDAAWTHDPERYTEYPGLPDLAAKVVAKAMASDFEVAVSYEIPRHPEHVFNGIGHAFGFMYRMIMRDHVVPNLPLIANTFFPPNQPSARRLYQFGELVAEVIDAWDSDLRVAVIGSGGMSHFCIDEEFDGMFFEAFKNRDAETLTSIDDRHFQSGTSELKNWVHAAGCLFNAGLTGELHVVDYVPCYRSEAGTGTANGFVYWT